MRRREHISAVKGHSRDGYPSKGQDSGEDAKTAGRKDSFQLSDSALPPMAHMCGEMRIGRDDREWREISGFITDLGIYRCHLPD